jgi:hypothetical protein
MLKENKFIILALVALFAIGLAPMDYVGIGGVAFRATALVPLFWLGIIDSATVDALVIY